MRCGRYDLLNKMYQAMGQWEKAVDVAQKKDRIHLKVTHHQWARELEAAGEYIY
jgi:intraflagellar transport protein 140